MDTADPASAHPAFTEQLAALEMEVGQDRGAPAPVGPDRAPQPALECHARVGPQALPKQDPAEGEVRGRIVRSALDHLPQHGGRRRPPLGGVPALRRDTGQDRVDGAQSTANHGVADPFDERGLRLGQARAELRRAPHALRPPRQGGQVEGPLVLPAKLRSDLGQPHRVLGRKRRRGRHVGLVDLVAPVGVVGLEEDGELDPRRDRGTAPVGRLEAQQGGDLKRRTVQLPHARAARHAGERRHSAGVDPHAHPDHPTHTPALEVGGIRVLQEAARALAIQHRGRREERGL